MSILHARLLSSHSYAAHLRSLDADSCCIYAFTENVKHRSPSQCSSQLSTYRLVFTSLYDELLSVFFTASQDEGFGWG